MVASYVSGTALKAEVVVDEFRYPCASLLDAVICCVKIYVLMRLKFCSNTGYPFLFILRHCANIIRPEDADMTGKIDEVVKKYFVNWNKKSTFVQLIYYSLYLFIYLLLLLFWWYQFELFSLTSKIVHRNVHVLGRLSKDPKSSYTVFLLTYGIKNMLL